jgi:hypothetical protein
MYILLYISPFFFILTLIFFMFDRLSYLFFNYYIFYYDYFLLNKIETQFIILYI